MVSRSSATSGPPAPLLFVVGGVSMYVGAALAVGLFAQASPAGVAWLRLAGAAVVLGAWRLGGAVAGRRSDRRADQSNGSGSVRHGRVRRTGWTVRRVV